MGVLLRHVGANDKSLSYTPLASVELHLTDDPLGRGIGSGEGGVHVADATCTCRESEVWGQESYLDRRPFRGPADDLLIVSLPCGWGIRGFGKIHSSLPSRAQGMTEKRG